LIDGFVFRFAACQCGQKTAGSPLGCLVRAVARTFARLTDPVHVASCVDDLIFIMSTPKHGECAGFEGGCAVCEDYYGRALKVQAMWQQKARALNILPSAKGHAVGQRGAFIRLAIDTYIRLAIDTYKGRGPRGVLHAAVKSRLHGNST
jgi:hypothetical protein